MPTAAPQLALFPDFIGEVAPPRPKLVLPWKENEEVDTKRAGQILGVSKLTIRRLVKAKCIRGYQLGGHGKEWRINYDSIIEFCDELRKPIAYALPKQPKREPGRRLKDDQILPFPMSEMVDVKFAAEVMHCGETVVGHLIESGDLVAYRLLRNTARTPWRIHLPSLERLVDSCNQMAAKKTGRQ